MPPVVVGARGYYPLQRGLESFGNSVGAGLQTGLRRSWQLDDQDRARRQVLEDQHRAQLMEEDRRRQALAHDAESKGLDASALRRQIENPDTVELERQGAAGMLVPLQFGGPREPEVLQGFRLNAIPVDEIARPSSLQPHGGPAATVTMPLPRVNPNEPASGMTMPPSPEFALGGQYRQRALEDRAAAADQLRFENFNTAAKTASLADPVLNESGRQRWAQAMAPRLNTDASTLLPFIHSDRQTGLEWAKLNQTRSQQEQDRLFKALELARKAARDQWQGEQSVRGLFQGPAGFEFGNLGGAEALNAIDESPQMQALRGRLTMPPPLGGRGNYQWGDPASNLGFQLEAGRRFGYGMDRDTGPTNQPELRPDLPISVAPPGSPDERELSDLIDLARSRGEPDPASWAVEQFQARRRGAGR